MLRMILYFCQSVFFAEMSACFSAFRGKRMPGTSCRFRCSGKESSSCRTAWGRGVPPVRACGRRGCTELFRKACSCAGPGRAAETCIREHVQSAGAACPRGPGWRARGKHVPVIAFERERDSGLPEKQCCPPVTSAPTYFPAPFSTPFPDNYKTLPSPVSCCLC